MLAADQMKIENPQIFIIKFENKNREKKSKVGKLDFFKIGKSHKWDYSAVPSEVLNEMSKIIVSRAKVRK